MVAYSADRHGHGIESADTTAKIGMEPVAPCGKNHGVLVFRSPDQVMVERGVRRTHGQGFSRTPAGVRAFFDDRLPGVVPPATFQPTLRVEEMLRRIDILPQLFVRNSCPSYRDNFTIKITIEITAGR
jgi:hypothetical protein